SSGREAARLCGGRWQLSVVRRPAQPLAPSHRAARRGPEARTSLDTPRGLQTTQLSDEFRSAENGQILPRSFLTNLNISGDAATELSPNPRQIIVKKAPFCVNLAASRVAPSRRAQQAALRRSRKHGR